MSTPAETLRSAIRVGGGTYSAHFDAVARREADGRQYIVRPEGGVWAVSGTNTGLLWVVYLGDGPRQPVEVHVPAHDVIALYRYPIREEAA